MRNDMPSFGEFNALTLKLMEDGEARPNRRIKERVLEHLQLSPEIMAERYDSGESRAENRIAWACSNLFRAGLLDRPQRGVYQLSETGRQLLPTVGDTLGETEFAELPKWQEYKAERAARDAAKQGRAASASAPAATTDAEQDPESTALAAIEALNDDLAVDLLRRLREGSPEFFERAVIRVLRGMGYGGAGDSSDVEALRRESHTGGSGDGGIDGIIKLDPLGVQNIYIQAKRYAEGNSVGRPELNAFVGALHGKPVTRGVFITTSHYTSEAKDFASRDAKDRLVIIDGTQLTTLMLAYGVGVQKKRTLEVLEVDEDFFE